MLTHAGKEVATIDLKSGVSQLPYLVNADAECLSFCNDTFDKILCAEVLEHLLNPFKAVGEISRVAKPNSEIVVSVPSPFSIDEIIGQIKGRVGFYEHISVIPLSRFLGWCDELGLQAIGIRRACFNFQIGSRVLNSFPLLLPAFRLIESVAGRAFMLNNLCWTNVIKLKNGAK